MSGPKPHLSPTQIVMFQRCGMQYWFRYIEGIKAPPGIAQVVGITAHDVAARILEEKRDKGSVPPKEFAEDIARTRVEYLLSQEVAYTESEKEEGEDRVRGRTIDTAIAIVRRYHEDYAPVIEPLDIERPWRLELDGFPYDIEGRIDCRERNGTIRDLKIGQKSLSHYKTEAATSIPLTLYHLAVSKLDPNLPPKQMKLDVIRTLKTPVSVTIETQRTDEDYKRLFQRIETMVRALEHGLFMPCAPDDWVCDPVWCGYWNRCPYGKGDRHG